MTSAPSRRLDLTDAVALFVGIILGSGVFVAPREVTAAAPELPVAIALWLGGAFVAACGACTYAECASRLPSNGGFFVYYRAVYGEWLAFVGGWAAQLVTYPASIAAIAVLGASYLVQLTGLGASRVSIVASAMLVVSAALHVIGVRVGAWSQRVLTLAKVLVVVLVCLAALFASGTPATAISAPLAAGALVPAFVGILWAYDGWSDVTLVAGELKRPERDLGRAVVLGIVTLACVYVLVQVSVVLLLGAPAAAVSEAVFADAARAGLGDAGARLVGVLVVVSTFGSVNGIVLTASRLGQAMALEGAFFGYFAESSRRGTPTRSIVLLAAACLAYVWGSDFRGLLAFFGQTIWTFYGLTGIALLVLRRRGVGADHAWRAPVGPIAPYVLITTAIVMTVLLARESPSRFAIGLGLTALGLPVYALWKRTRTAR